MKAYYYACISYIDYQVGQISDTLDATGQRDNTLIVFTSDHGEHLGDYNCFGKRSFHDTAAKIPMILSMPGKFDGGKRCDTPVSLIDLAPTFMAAAEGSISSHALDGVNLHDIVTEKSSRDTVFGQLSYYGHNNVVANSTAIHPTEAESLNIQRARNSTYMAVTKDWKYFYSAPDEKEFLFDKNYDSEETRNKAGIIFNKDPLEMMRHKTMAFLKAGGETTGIKGGHWVPYGKQTLPSDPDTGLLIQDTQMAWVKNSVPGYSEHDFTRMF